MHQIIRAVWRDERASVALEYALIAAIVSSGLIVGLHHLASDTNGNEPPTNTLSRAFGNIAAQL